MCSITWKDAEAASAQLLAEARPFDEQFAAGLGTRPGIYVFIYAGNELGGSLWSDPRPLIVYLGHAGEDSIRHWQNDTGVSTVRRSLAALLAGNLHLLARPNDDAAGEDRFYNYRLQEASELQLSAWMRENLRVAFLPCEEAQVEAWYRALLEYNTPMLVLRNNPDNSYGPQIKLYRSQLAEQAAHS